MKFRTHLAALFCILVVSVSSAPAADPPSESQVPGQIRVARWDVILNDNGLESIDSTDNSVVHTPSVGYSASVFNADALRAAVNAAQAVGGLEGGSQSMVYTQIFNNSMYNMQPLYFNYYQGQAMHVGLQGNAQGSETYDTPDSGHIHIKLDYPQIQRQLMEGDNGQMNFRELRDKASITYDGQLSPGDALVFSGTLKTKSKIEYRHMIVWEAFKAEDRYQQDFQAMQDSERWCQMGPKTIRDDGDIALVWGAQAKLPASTAASKWQQTLDDGKIARLTGLTRSDKWLFCWWDADGQPIDSHQWLSFTKYYQNQPVWFSVEVTGSVEESKKQTPTGHSGVNRGEPTGPFNTSMCTVADKNGQAEVGVLVGPWEQIGEINKGGRIKVGNETYVLRNIQSSGPDFMFVNFSPDRYGADRNELVTLSAVGLDGTELDTNYLPTITGRNFGIPSPNFQGFSLKNLKTFHVWKRKIQWVTFSGFAAQPLTLPKDHVTAAELSAAVDAQNKSQQQIQLENAKHQLEDSKAMRKEWEAISADPKTPRGALRALFEAASKGDLHSVRARLTAKQSGAGPMLDTTAHFITAMQSARFLAIQRFGEANVDALQSVNTGTMGAPAMIDLEGEIIVANQSWRPRADGGLESDDVSIVKGANGEFVLDLSATFDKANWVQQTSAMVMMTGLATRADQLHQLMKKNPSLTIEQMRKAIAQPATQATTKPAG